MTDAPPPPPAPRHGLTAVLKHGKWPGLVWAVPLAALLIVAYLGLRALAQRGVDAVITFDSADGVMVGETKVMYRGVSVGHVVAADLDKDGKRVDVTVRLDPRLKPALVDGTEFWLLGAKPDLTDISSLKAALEGVTIGLAPATTGEPTRRFRGLQEPPIVIPGTAGTNYVATGEQLGAIRPGSDIIYRGMDVGKVTSVALADRADLRIGLFVQAPYDRLVRADTLFWIAAPLQISLSGGGLTTQILPQAALSGGVEFDTQPESETEAPSAAGTTYTLYSEKSQALAGGKGPQILYDVRFSESAGDLDVGAPVKLGQFKIGSVKQVRMAFDAEAGSVDARVTIAIEPRRLNLTGVAPPPDGNWRPVADAALNKLFQRGYRAGLSQSPPVIGSPYVSIDHDSAAGPAAIAYDSDQPRLPSRADRDIGAIADKIGSIADKLDAVPLEQIGENIRQSTQRLSQLLGSPQVVDSIKHLDSTLDQLDQMMREVRPKLGPLVANLNEAADQLQKTATSANKVLSGQGASQDSGLPDAIRELTEAARSIRALTDYLGRHPEALISGKSRQGS
jgi:paraquat-inducible protein B